MSDRSFKRFLVFTGVHFFPLVALCAVQACSLLSSYYDPGNVLFLMGVAAGIMAAASPGYMVWTRSMSFWKRLLAIDLGWCLILAVFIFMAGSMGMGLALAQQGKTLPRIHFYISSALYAVAGTVFLQILIVPWTLLSMWIMRKLEPKLIKGPNA